MHLKTTIFVYMSVLVVTTHALAVLRSTAMVARDQIAEEDRRKK
jgi:hypothetical protein